ncbi:MAG TPA: DNA replication and repair protein RecF [Solirubrobacteraceae bacterium]
MQVLSLSLRDFRGYHDAEVAFGEGLTVVTGPNGAGKTNLLEGLYFACTGRSCRTSNEREVVKFGAGAARTVLSCEADDGLHELSVGFVPGQPKAMRVDGAAVERMLDVDSRPLVSVFLPDRLELIKGPPAVRRAHLDQFVSALWPARRDTRRLYGQALAQRNALIARIRAGRGSRESLRSWDAQLAGHGIALMSDRRGAVDLLAETFERLGAALGLEREPRVAYRPRSRATDAAELARELADRLDADLERGFTGHGPHRDDLATEHDGHDLRAYGSQGQQRLALLALLLAEREVIARHRTAPPLMLLDDVMSELDRDRRQSLVELLRSTAGQSVITATDLEHVPGSTDGDVTHLAVSDGRLLAMAGE